MTPNNNDLLTVEDATNCVLNFCGNLTRSNLAAELRLFCERAWKTGEPPSPGLYIIRGSTFDNPNSIIYKLSNYQEMYWVNEDGTDFNFFKYEWLLLEEESDAI